ncbi:disulfide bond formation protein DsbB [Lihuaxuella thermophila]|uniref:Disulfide bond formation protein DsbB n=2 Tax=Lihuaxuella thermophila TaxID=1173111 RepID=A0A1H8EPW2_9BACL|nr:disulfide oxidoreductase [Lihuaxuella thermophila]SEN21154.1 disulfide bond formation protein DsbB [Lihuaxuella thermophila]
MNKNSSFIRAFQAYSLYFAWIVSLVATGGSLYFSEIAGYIPCTLCWFQRIFMYPLVFLLGIASYRDDRSIIPYIYPLTIVGGLISLYHVLLQNIPGLANISPCTVGVPCHLDYIHWFGFITIPVLALTAFILISLLLWSASKVQKD